MSRLAQEILKRREKKWDAFIIVDGPRGNGKSTFLYKLMAHLGEFIPERDIVFSREDLISRMREKFGLILQDEMINAAHNRDFYEKDQKMLIKLLNMYRDNYNIIGGAVPFFYDLDPQVRKFVFLRVTITERGKAIIQKGKSSMFTNDPWETDSNRKLEMEMQRAIKKGKKPRVNYSKLTTFWGTLTYGPLSKKQEARYHKIKETKRNQLLGDAEEIKTNKDKENVVHVMAERKQKGLLDPKDFESYCRVMGKKRESVMVAMSRHIRNLQLQQPMR